MKKNFLIIMMLLLMTTTGCNDDTKSNDNTSVVEKQEITEIEIEFENQSFVYDGMEHNITITGELPEGVTVEYTNNGKVNVGEYEVIATFIDTTGNYEVPSPMTAKMTISKASIKGISFESQSFVYDGSEHNITIMGELPEGVTVEYTNNGKVKVGEYEVIATFIDTTGNYEVPSPMTAALSVTQPFTYEIMNSEAIITGTYDSVITLEIPSSIEVEGVLYEVTTILEEAFKDCNNLISITFGSNIKNVAKSAFAGCQNLKDVYYDGTIEDWYDIEFANDNSNPMGCADNFNIKDEGEWSKLTELVIPDSIYKILNKNFSNLKNLKSITVHSKVTVIQCGAFENCINLESITLPFIGKTATSSYPEAHFSYIFGASSYNYKNYVPVTLKTVNVTNATSIPEYAFYNCTNIENINLNSKVLTIWKYAFAGCELLKDFVFPSNLMTIETYAFANCIGLIEVIVPKNVTKIGQNAFNNCRKLEMMEIPFVGESSSASGEKGLFGYIFGAQKDTYSTYTNTTQYYGTSSKANTYITEKLKKVIVSQGSKIKDYSFNGCKTIEEIVLCESTTYIGLKAFYNCYGLKYINLADTKVGYIDSDAFRHCTSLEFISVEFAKSPQKPSLKKQTFAGCTALKSIILSSIESVEESVFFECDNLKEIYFTGTKDEYDAITVNSTGNTQLSKVTVYYFSDSEPQGNGNYWHYDENGNVKIWK